MVVEIFGPILHRNGRQDVVSDSRANFSEPVVRFRNINAWAREKKCCLSGGEDNIITTNNNNKELL